LKAGKPSAAKERGQALTRRDIKMVEDAFRKEHYFKSLTELRKSLPRKVKDENLKAVVVHIENSNKIERNRDGSLVWIWMESEAAKKSLRESTPL
jgi:hypothetical protein